jgi:hypothetical protein
MIGTIKPNRNDLIFRAEKLGSASSALPRSPQIKRESFPLQTLELALAAQLAQKKSTLLKNRIGEDLQEN